MLSYVEIKITSKCFIKVLNHPKQDKTTKWVVMIQKAHKQPPIGKKKRYKQKKEGRNLLGNWISAAALSIEGQVLT